MRSRSLFLFWALGAVLLLALVVALRQSIDKASPAPTPPYTKPALLTPPTP
jgi:hypothetical protein